MVYHACTMRGSRGAPRVVSRCKCLLGVAKCVGAMCAAIVPLCLRKVVQEKRKDAESDREKAGPVLRTQPMYTNLRISHARLSFTRPQQKLSLRSRPDTTVPCAAVCGIVSRGPSPTADVLAREDSSRARQKSASAEPAQRPRSAMGCVRVCSKIVQNR